MSTVIGARALHGNLHDPAWRVLDCRYDLADKDAGRRAYLRAHIPGAAHVRLDTDLSDSRGETGGRHPLPSRQRLSALFSELGIAAETQVVAYDADDGAFAARLWWLLRYAGHARVAVLDGGLQSWRRAAFPVETGEARPRDKRQGEPPAAFQARFNDAMLVDRAQVPQSALLVDSREPERYRGEREPLDPVAGHIPGAVNRHWKKNLAATGEFKPPPVLAAELRRLFAAVPPQEAVFYCGSGVTACHNLLAAAYAGLPLPRLYPGSWSEWCADPNRPVAVGDHEVTTKKP